MITDVLLSRKIPGQAQSEGHTWPGHSQTGSCLDTWKGGPSICSGGELPGISVSAPPTFVFFWSKGVARLVSDKQTGGLGGEGVSLWISSRDHPVRS